MYEMWFVFDVVCVAITVDVQARCCDICGAADEDTEYVILSRSVSFLLMGDIKWTCWIRRLHMLSKPSLGDLESWDLLVGVLADTLSCQLFLGIFISCFACSYTSFVAQ